jgi:hypothetical protein
MTSHRILLYWPGRTDPVSALAQQIHGFLSQASALHPKLAGFLFQPRGGAPEPVASVSACEEALRRSAGTWQSGGRELTSYAPRFFLERPTSPPVEVTITCGIEPLGLEAIFTPNRLDLRVRAADERVERPALEGMMRAAITAFRPDFACAGSERVPKAPLSLFSDGTPPVGWMTYFRRAFPALPRTLPEPAVAYPVEALGTLIVAHPDPFDEADPAHRDALARVGEALSAAGVLVSSLDLPRGG